MSIWSREVTLEQVNQIGKGTMMEALDIQFTEITDDSLIATMPVDKRTVQPHGILHGGASAVLAESLGSVAGNLVVGPDKFCVGVEVNANHLRPARSGLVTGTAKPLKLGGSIQVWEIKICNNQKELCCAARLTLAVREKR